MFSGIEYNWCGLKRLVVYWKSKGAAAKRVSPGIMLP
jgi:hypothetical protein